MKALVALAHRLLPRRAAPRDPWSRFLDERYSPVRTVVGSWALWQRPGFECRAFPLEPLQPWLVADVELAPPHVSQRVRVLAWESGIPLATFLEHARVVHEDDDARATPDEVIAALQCARARAVGSGDDIRISLDGRLLRSYAGRDSAATALATSCLRTPVEAASPPVLRDLVRALFADEARKDDEAREDLAALTRAVIDAHWDTFDLGAVGKNASTPRMNLSPKRR